MSAEEVLAALAKHAQAYPDQDPLIGMGFLSTAFGEQGPTAAMLDTVVSDRPAMIFDEGFHSAWINTRAMQLAGLDASTPDPVPGAHYFKRDENGAPTGWLIEGGAFQPIAERLAVVTPDRLAAGADSFLGTMSAMGITAAFDAGFVGNNEMILELFGSLAERGALPVRTVGSHYVNLPGQLAGAVSRVETLQRRFNAEFFDLRVLKLSLDGTVEARTALMLAPYTSPEGHRAML